MNIDMSAITGLEEIEDGYLLGTLYIMDIPHHVAMIEVTEEDGMQIATGPSEIVDNMLEEARHLDGADGPYWTVVYGDKEYVIIITPYCR